MTQIKRLFMGTTLAALLLLAGVWVSTPRPVLAAATIVVNSTADDQDDDGECTLREAIVASNTDTASGGTTGECIAGDGVDTINFSITGTADYTLTDRNNVVRNGYTINLQSSLPEIEDTVVIDGYSQPGSLANTAVAPAPLNGTLLVEVSAGDIPSAMVGIVFGTGSDDSVLKGLVLNEFTESGSQVNTISTIAHNVAIQGNYIGTNPAGTVAKSNDVGLNHGENTGDGTGTLIGGLNAADRNLISGNTEGDSATAGYPGEAWVVQGNYIGVAADGQTIIANSTPGGSGSLSIDDVADVIIGGDQEGAINVIAGSQGHGLAPDGTDNLLIEGNYIGVAADGQTVIGNGDGNGISLSDATDTIIRNNLVAGGEHEGIYMGRSDGVEVIDNTVYDNAGKGIWAYGSVNVQIGRPNQGNQVYGNGSQANIMASGISGFGFVTSNVTVQGNMVGYDANGVIADDQEFGILALGDATDVLIGGTAAGEGNTVRGSKGAGIAVSNLQVVNAGNTVIPANKVSILGNTVQDNVASGLISTGLGIDLLTSVDASGPPDGIGDTFTSDGVTPNDASDSDTGPNSLTNFPTLNSAKQTGTSLALDFDLDAAGSTSNEYRVEFFANDSADPSGYGEGQTFIGATTASNGSNITTALTLPNGFDLTGKVLSATTTAVDGTTDSGFGSTSEFSAVLAAEVIAATTDNTSSSSPLNGNLAKTGQTVRALVLIGVAISAATIAITMTKRKYAYKIVK